MSRSNEGDYTGRTRHRGGHLDPSVETYPHDDLQAALGPVEE